jgi:hypothetical protein
MSVVVVISQHLLNVFVQLANKRGLKKKVTPLQQSTFARIPIVRVASTATTVTP